MGHVGNVEASCADDGIRFVQLAVCCLKRILGEALDCVVNTCDIIFLQSLEVPGA